MKTMLAYAVLFLPFLGIGQDLIFKKDQDVIECTITEISDEEVKYRKESLDVVFVLATTQIEKVVFENGEEMSFSEALHNPKSYIGAKTTAWKFGFLSPLTGASNFSYEKLLRPGRSVEATVGFIGLAKNFDGLHQAGVYVKGGYKFISDPIFKLRGMTYSHPLMGIYVKPEVVFCAYEQEYYSYYYQPGGASRGINNIYSGAVLLNFGKQRIFANVIALDFSVGVGYAFDNMTERKLGGFSDSKVAMNHYAYLFGGDIPLAFTGSIRVGFLTR